MKSLLGVLSLECILILPAFSQNSPQLFTGELYIELSDHPQSDIHACVKLRGMGFGGLYDDSLTYSNTYTPPPPGTAQTIRGGDTTFHTTGYLSWAIQHIEKRTPTNGSVWIGYGLYEVIVGDAYVFLDYLDSGYPYGLNADIHVQYLINADPPKFKVWSSYKTILNVRSGQVIQIWDLMDVGSRWYTGFHIAGNVPIDPQTCDTLFTQAVADGNVTVPSNKALVVNPSYYPDISKLSPIGITFPVGVGGGYGAMLNIYGQLNAQGTSSQRITFDRPGSSGSWYGLVLQSGSTGTVSYCSFNHATVGVSCNSSSPTISYCTFLNNYFGIYCNPCTPTIQYNDIENSSNSGIYLTGASPNLTGNTIKNNSQYGVFCLNYSGPYMTSNTISGSQFSGLYCDSYSSPTLSSIAGVGNVISLTGGSAIDIQASHYSNPFLGFGGSSGNSIEGNPWYYVSATYGSNVIAQGNWWGSYPPNSGRFNVYPQGSIDYSRALTSDPNPGRPKVQAPGQDVPHPIIAFVSDSTFNLAFQDGLAGKYDDAIALYLKVYNANPKTSLLAQQAILFLAETYERSGKTAFIDLLHSQIAPTVPLKSELSVISRELEAHWLTKAGRYDDALSMFQALHSDYPDTPEIDKHALFNIGEIYQSFLGNHAKAVEYFSQFQLKYPNDPLTPVAGLLMSSKATPFVLSQQKVGGTVANKDPNPTAFVLESNYPNPFNPSTQIRYSLPEAGKVSLAIYDVLGREIANLADGYQQAGRYTVTWNSTQNSGMPVSSGVYFARLRVTNDLGGVKYMKTMRLLLMK